MQDKTLYLIPTTLGGNKETIPAYVSNVCSELDAFIVENLRSARRYLRSIGFKKDFDNEVSFYELNKHSKDELEPLFTFLNENKNIGLLSEAGNPCIADPGALAVSLCHELKIQVKPLVGPSSILMALIASGFDGQNFTFHGYLPIENSERNKAIKDMEGSLKRTGYTQIFMETPYRNEKMITSVLKICNKQSKLCIAADISLDTEHIETRTIENWNQKRQNYHKRPAIFVLGN
ncbi:MAG: SAM-dependent methyltransferase [Chitinophagales bacterium]